MLENLLIFLKNILLHCGVIGVVMKLGSVKARNKVPTRKWQDVNGIDAKSHVDLMTPV